VLGKRRAEAAGRRQTEAGGVAPKDGDVVPVAGGQESGGEVARKLLRDDVVLVVCLAEAKRQWIAGTTARPSGGESSSSPAPWSGQSNAGEQNWVGLRASVGRDGAARALDRGWEAAAVAVDGEQELRWGSSEVGSSGERKVVEMQACDGQSEFIGSSWMCFRSRRGHSAREQLLASRRHAWSLGRRRRDVEKRGEGQRGVGSGGAGAGAARGTEESGAGAAGARHMAGKGGGSRARAEQRRGTGGRRRGTYLQFPKSAGTPL
jgi:hypothetical protein